MDVNFKEMNPKDWPKVSSIYQQGIDTGIATLETEVQSWNDWDEGHLSKCRLVACIEDEVVGWAALSPVSDRCVYGGVAEISIYIAEQDREKGIGKQLLESLVQRSEKQGIWTLQAGIFPENKASISVHKTCGFRVVGIREKLGKLKGEWKDVMLLERRSEAVGMD